ncbi:papilin isoform X2 [Monodelphis domestica]|uniref:papilin isoform X2 n=1 Tax=Monodelphis domestica TaxID=13616 RepID=UPI0024E1C662|nr:papilin isoform X2 [Monodelphis domestica]
MKTHLLLLMLLLLLPPLPVSSARKVRRQNENWGHWGEWSQCSRTCGGGVSFQERHCYSQRIDGSSSCIGPTRNYRSCNTESCPQGTRDFRAEQCAEFDGKEFQGKKYKWFPYYGAANKCELNCIPKGENFYYRHKEAVVDGTPCEPGKLDICVQGTCQAVGCDHVLYSSKKEDKCLRCGGDGQTCYPVKGTFDANDLTKGYNQILIIPAGATSIHIAEVTASRNFLAVKNVRGEYYLNGHWTIEFGRALPVASTILQYERGSEGDLAPEHLRARGPTSEPLVIELISQEPNPGVQYEYYLPHWPLDTGFTWSHGSWSDCSAECGGGYQTRLVFCTTINEVYPDHMCRHKPQPSDNRTCNLQACPQTKRISYLHRPGVWSHGQARGMCGKSWKTGPWTACSAPCGGGSQSRHVYCVVSDGAGMEEATDEASCSALPGRPPSTQSCNLHRCAAWSSGPWGECSASCGPGVRSRTVTCWGDEGSALQDFACSSADKPPLTEACMGENCPLQEPGWHIGDWGLCSKSCDSGIRKRQVICADRDSNVYSSDLCQVRQPQMPAEVEACNTQSCHLPQEVPSMQDVQGYDTSRQDPPETPSQGGREEWWLHRNQPPSEHSREGHGGSNLLPQHQESGWGSSGSRQYHQQRDPVSRPQPPDCRHSLHGCCPDGHTVAPGPLGRGCPRISCQQSTYGCCPDGVSSALGRNHAGCPRSHDETHVNRHGPRAASSPAESRPDPSVECRGSRYGCCYDNSASSTGPLGEGCQGRPSSPYPVRCLLPSAHGSCADWTPRWYFIPTVGKCNRFWYGGCHGNRNNFLSEEECMKSCHEGAEDSVTGPLTHGAERGWASPSQREIGTPLGPSQPRQGPSGYNQGGGTGDHHDASYHGQPSRNDDQSRTGESWGLDHTGTSQGRPSLSASTSRLEQGGQALRPEKTQLSRTFEQEISKSQHTGHQDREDRPSVFVPREDSRQPAPHSQVPSHRIVLDRTEYSGVQVTLGQMVRFFCVAGASPDVKWQKNGKPVRSSNRYHLQLDGSLAISSVSEEDAGTYTCSTSVGGQDSSRQVQLWITGDDREAPAEAERNLPPIQDHKHLDFGMGGGRPGHRPSSPRHRQPGPRLSFDRNQPGVVDANIGQRVQLPCRTSGYPPPVIEWQKDGQPLSSPRHQQQPDGSLLISRVSREDGGFYTCIAFNQREREQRWVQLRILGELKIVGLEPAVTVPEGGDTELHCVVLGDDVNVRWSRNGVPLRGDGYRIHLSQDGTLVINNTRARDEGSYTCSAYSGSQAVSRSTEVKVVYPRPPAVEQPRDPSRECIDQPELANCDLILQAQLCGNEYYSSFCCASCSRYQPQARPVWQQG